MLVADVPDTFVDICFSQPVLHGVFENTARILHSNSLLQSKIKAKSFTDQKNEHSLKSSCISQLAGERTIRRVSFSSTHAAAHDICQAPASRCHWLRGSSPCPIGDSAPRHRSAAPHTGVRASQLPKRTQSLLLHAISRPLILVFQGPCDDHLVSGRNCCA